jgi:hypothetical protein
MKYRSLSGGLCTGQPLHMRPYSRYTQVSELRFTNAQEVIPKGESLTILWWNHKGTCSELLLRDACKSPSRIYTERSNVLLALKAGSASVNLSQGGFP